MSKRLGLAFGVGAIAIVMAPQWANAQEQRLVGRLSDPIRVQVDSVLAAAISDGLPLEPLIDRALEGAAKGAPGDRIVLAVRRLADELTIARAAFGDSALSAELNAGASALRAGASREDLMQLKEVRAGQPLTVAAGVLADLVAVGVPTDTAITAVLVLAGSLDDAGYLAFRANVERDISMGASPSAALGVRLDGFASSSDALSLSPASPENGQNNAAGNPPTVRKKP